MIFNRHLIFILSLLLISGCAPNTEISLAKLNGKWINRLNDYIEIADTTKNNNFIGNNVGTIGKYLQINGDTLSFQDRYTSSEDNFSTKRIDRSDFKINLLTDSILSISPISKLASSLFDKDTIQFTKQELAIDHTIDFDKITFHSTRCYGHCPIYHLEVLKDGTTRLHREEVYKKDENGLYLLDPLSIGYYTGKISKNKLKELKHHIQTCNLDRLTFNEILCCDGSIETIIAEYNGKRKYLVDMFPPRIASNLIGHLYLICEESALKKTDTIFELDN